MDALDSPDAALDRAFTRAILAMERLRVTLVLIALVALSGVLVVVFVAEDAMFAAMYERGRLRYLALLVTAVAVLLELALRRRIGRSLADEVPLPRAWFVYGALIETSVPTGLMLSFSPFVHASELLASPPVLAYFLLLVLAPLTMNARYCVLLGALAAAQYLGLWALFAADVAREFPGTLFSVWPSYVLRAVLLFTGGVLAGVVTVQVRRSVVQALASARERDRVREVFGQHVSPAVVDKLLSQPTELAPEVRRLCVMFVDIRDFTRFSASRGPREVVDYLNALFGPLSECVARHHGIINKFLGDGFMAVFGAPLDDPAAERHGVAAARELLAETQRLHAHGVIPETSLGIGLHAGEAVTGTVGSQRRREYTIVGDTVNLAARIEQLNKRLGTRILASEAVVAALADDPGPATPLPPVTVRGLDAPIRVFRLDPDE